MDRRPADDQLPKQTATAAVNWRTPQRADRGCKGILKEEEVGGGGGGTKNGKEKQTFEAHPD